MPEELLPLRDAFVETYVPVAHDLSEAAAFAYRVVVYRLARWPTGSSRRLTASASALSFSLS
jgi:ABC-type proline/glycine betaine transport system ATPase subunit